MADKKFKTVEEWLKFRGFTILDKNTAEKGLVTVKFDGTKILSIRAGNDVLLDLNDLNNYLMLSKIHIFGL